MAGIKQSPNGEATAAPVSDLKALCYAMSTVEDFRLNTKALALALGINSPTNVPRKIRCIIEPLGFELKDGKITVKDDSGKTDANGDSASAPVTPAKGKKGGPKARTPKTPKTPGGQRSVNKKRKISEDDESVEDGNKENIKTEVKGEDAVEAKNEEKSNGHDEDEA